MKLKLTHSEYEFFRSLVQTVVAATVPNNITSLAGLSIMKQAYCRMPEYKYSPAKKRYSITLKDYEAIFIYKLLSSTQQSYSTHSFESNTMRKINWEIHKEIISPYV
jgi:hypothetical protein